MEAKDFMGLLEAAKKDKKKLKALKLLAVQCQQFQVAAEIRDMERELFPETEEMKRAVIEAGNLNTLFRMIDMNIPDCYAWLVNESIKRFGRRKGRFSLKDASELKAKMNELFGEEN